MALSADTPYTDMAELGGSGLPQIINNATPYLGSMIYVGAQSHGTSANIGRAAAWTGAAGEQMWGIALHLDEATGDTSASPIPAVQVEINGAYIKKVAVTGVSAATDVGRSVYMSDDATFTLTPPTRPQVVGKVMKWYSSTTADVLVYPMTVLDAIALGGNGNRVVHLGSYLAATLATGDIRTSYPMDFHGSFTKIFAHSTAAVTGSGGSSVAINLEIDGTNVSGGSLTVDSTAFGTLGDFGSGSSITAANYFHKGSLLDVEATLTGAALTGGSIDLYAECRVELGV